MTTSKKQMFRCAVCGKMFAAVHLGGGIFQADHPYERCRGVI